VQVLLFIGIPGAGKSTFYRDRFFDTHLRINLDQLRTRRREGILLHACFESKTRFVWDNTNVSRLERAEVLTKARKARFEAIAFYFEPDFAGSLRRNSGRSGRACVPESAIKGMITRLEKPNWDEGYTAIFSVWNLNDGSFDVEEWTREI
jgi:predicted kinase